MRDQDHNLIHLPHAGRKIPEEYLEDFFLSETSLKRNIDAYCDLYTDELFAGLLDRFDGVASEYSRLFFDPERFGDDEMEEMHQKFRLGWFYENAILSKEPLRSADHKNAIRVYYDAHHHELNEKTKLKLERYGKCTVIDCHSFSNERYWFHDQIVPVPDICIGFESSHVDHVLVAQIKDCFTGYEIAINTPYAGSFVPSDYWRKDKRVRSVMIEINKKLYLEDDGYTKSDGFDLVREKLDSLL